jgi:hypothetical protein
LAAHIQRGEANEKIVERHDLAVASSMDLADDIEAFAAAGHARGVTKSLIHAIVSPSHPLTLRQEAAMLATLCRAYGIPAGHPIICVEHVKPGAHDRPSHYHFVAPRVRSDGACVSSSSTYAKNERVARELECDFGHEIGIGRFSRAVREMLEKERPDISELIDPTVRAERSKSEAQTVADKQQAHLKGADLDAFDRDVLNAWVRAKGDAVVIAKSLAANNIAVAQGDKAVMVVHEATGFSNPLDRVINRESKRRGDVLRVKGADVRRLFPNQKPLAQVVSRGLTRSLQKSRVAAATERFLERQFCAIVGAAPEPKAATEKAPPTKTTKLSQASARREIVENYAMAKKKRRRLVDRAWQRAGLFASRDARKMLALGVSVAALAIGAPVILGIATYYATSTALAIKRAVDIQNARSITAGAKAADRAARANLQVQLAAVGARRGRHVRQQGATKNMEPAARLAANESAAASTLMAASNSIAQAKRGQERLAGGGQQAAFGFEFSGAIARRASTGKRVVVSVFAAIHREVVASAAQGALVRVIEKGRRGRASELSLSSTITDEKRPWLRLAALADLKGRSADAIKIARHFEVADELARLRAIRADPTCADDAERDLVRSISSWPKVATDVATIAALRAAGAHHIASLISQQGSDEVAHGR